MKIKNNLRAVLTSAMFLIILGGFFLMNLIITPPEISKSERRVLKKMPELSLKSVVSGKFMNEFEGYAADSFPYREEFRSLRALTVFHVFRQTDKSGLYFGKSGIGKFEPVNETEYRRSAAKIRTMAQRLEGLNIYYSIIPDKSIYAGYYMPGFDLEQATAIISEELAGLTYIDMASILTGEDYYHSDLHWDQTRLKHIVNLLSEEMEFQSSLTVTLKEAGLFEGVYAGQLALPIKPDKITYYIPENSDENNLAAKYLNARGTIDEGLVYDHGELKSNDPYSFFMRGPQPLIWIPVQGEKPSSDKTLYIFRDSFSSSLAPLLAFCGGYSEVVLIDLRYIDSRVLDQYVDFKEGSDVLFLYGSQILNNSTILKVH